jgi:plastocyanin
MNKTRTNYLLVVSLVLIAAILILSIAGCSSSATTANPATTPPAAAQAVTTPPAATPAGNAVTINVVAQNMAFDQSTITVKAGAQVTLNFNNKDTMPHNVAFYTDQSAAQVIYKGEGFSGPASKTYTFTAPTTPGTYFFRCDVHPTKMTGQFIVQ